MPTLHIPATTRIRRSVYALPPGDQTLHWYAVGVGRMQARLIADPLSWRYQAARHEYKRSTDPLAKPADVLPPGPDQTRYWNACQHGGAFFLPWHRFYLALFERIVGAEIVAAGGPADWGLPYWDYSESLATSPHARALPPDFRQPAAPANPLYVAQRRTAANNGLAFATSPDVSISCLASTPFAAAAAAANHGFAGQLGSPNHNGGGPGSLEFTPHGSMHNAIGGTKPGACWMSSFDTAALDPIFWLHHANIDRLWEVWRSRHPSLANPTAPAWLTQAFDFHDANGVSVTLPVAETLDIKADLGYDYHPPIPLAGGGVPLVAPVANVMHPIVSPAHTPVLAQVSGTSLLLTGPATHVALARTAPPAPAPAAVAPLATALSAVPRRSFLHLENVTADRPVESYEVYVGVPPGAEPRVHPECFAGLLPMFGVPEASKAGPHQAGDGRTMTLDVTGVLASLGLPPDGGPTLQVSLLPHRDEEPTQGPAAQAKVGRISLYVE